MNSPLRASSSITHTRTHTMTPVMVKLRQQNSLFQQLSSHSSSETLNTNSIHRKNVLSDATHPVPSNRTELFPRSPVTERILRYPLSVHGCNRREATALAAIDRGLAPWHTLPTSGRGKIGGAVVVVTLNCGQSPFSHCVDDDDVDVAKTPNMPQSSIFRNCESNAPYPFQLVVCIEIYYVCT